MTTNVLDKPTREWKPGDGQFNIPDETGHSKQIWDPANEDEVEAAKVTFDRLRAKGYSAFEVKEDGEQGKRIDKFDPKSGKLIMVAPLKGG